MSVYPSALPTVRPAVRSAFEQGSGGGAASIIAGLFSQGQQGFWLPFTDFASLTQDSAGTLPYTALEQPVGRVLDRSGRGNHATQVTSTARGAVSARVNKLTNTDDLAAEASFIDASKTAAGFAADGTTPAWKFTENAANTPHKLLLTGMTTANLRHSIYFEAKAQERSQIFVADAGVNSSLFNLATGVVTPHASATCSMVDLGGGWWGCTDTRVSLYTTPYIILGKDGAYSYLGDGVSGLSISKLQVSLGAPVRFQRVNTPTDYDSVGFPKYLRLDGTDDFYTCGGGGSTTGFYYSDVIRPMVGAGTARFLMSDRIGGFTGYMLSLTAANKLELALGGGGTYTRCASTDSINVGTQYFIEALDDGVNLQVAVNGGTPVTVPRPATPTYGGSAIMLYKNTIANDSIYNGQITEPIYRAGPPPSAYERSVIRTYQMQKAGML